MTAAGLPSEQSLSAWYRRFPDRKHLWAGRLRLWHVELPVRSPTPPNSLEDWVARASADGASPAAVARRLGLPIGVVAALHPDARPAREQFTFLDLPSGPHRVPAAGGPFEPLAVNEVPEAVLRPDGVEVVALSGDWRTVPVVRAEAVDVVAVWFEDRIEVYAASEADGSALWRLPADAMPIDGVR